MERSQSVLVRWLEAGDRGDTDAFCSLLCCEAAELASRYAAAQLPTRDQGAVAAFLAEYGMRGVGEIDLGVPRWRENPIDVLRSLQSYTQIRDPNRHPTPSSRAAPHAPRRPPTNWPPS